MTHEPTTVPPELRRYAAALRLFPPAHRRRFGTDQLLLAEDMVRHGEPPSRLWRALVRDLGAAWLHAAATAGTHVDSPELTAAFPGFPPRHPEVAAITRRTLALYTTSDLRGREVYSALAAEGKVHDREVWRALVDLMDAGLIVDDELPTRDRPNYRMDSRFRITEAGAAVAAAAGDAAG
ncbi:MAG: hypothetical protein U0R80_09695 [Nocardioidaceae bacterium]